MVALLKSIVLLALASVSTAHMHQAAICVKKVNTSYRDIYIYNAAATIASCQDYKGRNTGVNRWDHCRDCFMNTSNRNHHCKSNSWSMGGNEWEDYCKMHGAEKGLAW